MADPTQHITALVKHLETGGETTWDELLPEVYGELHKLAEQYMSSQRRDHTLQPTALVNEAYLKLAKWKGHRWKDRSHFMAAAALVMRQVLVDYARTTHRKKRGGQQKKVPLEEVLVSLKEQSLGLVELNDALEGLAKEDERCSHVVTLRFFGGLNFPEIAGVLRVSESTVERDWSYARVWLYRKLQ